MNILIVRNDKIGDFITSLPACYILKQYLPDCKITVLIAPINKSIAETCDFIDNIIVDDKHKSTKALTTQLKLYRFDISFTLFSNTRVAIAQCLAHIPKRYAPATKVAQIFYNKRIKQHRSQVKNTEFEYNIQLIQAAFPSININYPSVLLHFPEEEIQTTYHQFCTKLNIKKPVIAFHPGFGGSSDANWNIHEYIELAKSIEHKDIAIVFTFGAGDEVFFEAFEKHKGDLKALAYFSKGSVADFAKLIASFKLFVSTSTGTFHLASAVGTATMTFFADTLFASDQRWLGIGDVSLQHNYMIPKEPDKRSKLFRKIKNNLQKDI